MKKQSEDSSYCVKRYPYIDAGGAILATAFLEFKVHYVVGPFVRATALRYKIDDEEIVEIPQAKHSREWLLTSGIGWFRLEQL